MYIVESRLSDRLSFSSFGSDLIIESTFSSCYVKKIARNAIITRI